MESVERLENSAVDSEFKRALSLNFNRERCAYWSAIVFWIVVAAVVISTFFDATRWIAEQTSSHLLTFLAGSLAYFFSLAAPTPLSSRLLYANALAVFAGIMFALGTQDSVPKPTHSQLCEAGVYVYARVMIGMSIGTWLAWLFVHPSRNVKPRPADSGH